MSQANLNNVWNMMRDNKFSIDKESDNDLLCTICNCLIINAHVVPCGCRYCLSCIKRYLEGKEKVCLGKTEDCEEVTINMDKNVFPGQWINKKILRTIVKCPEENCFFTDELINIDRHMRVCDARAVDCPYLSVGCKQSNIINSDMKDHVLMEIVSHSKMMLDSIDILKTESDSLKVEIMQLRKENKDMRNDIQALRKDKNLKATEMAMLQGRCENQTKDINEIKKQLYERDTIHAEDQTQFEELKSKCERDEVRIEQLISKEDEKDRKIDQDLKLMTEKMDTMSMINMELKMKLDENIGLISKLKDKMKRNGDEFKIEMEAIKKDQAIDKSYEEILRKCEKETEEINSLKENLRKTISELEQEKQKSVTNKKSIQTFEKKMTEIERNFIHQFGGEFVWKIDNWKEKTEKAISGVDKEIYSEAFYSHRNGYKMCLLLYPNGVNSGFGTDLSVFFCVMNGEYDDILTWPFKYAITFELLDQRTKQPHTSETAKYRYDPNDPAYQKPTSKRNIGMGFDYFISLKELSNHIGLIENNQIYIRCRVKMD